MPKEVAVAGVTIDPVSKSPVVVLREPESGNVVPISAKRRIVRSSRSLGWEVMNRIRDIRSIAEILRSSSGNGISPSFFP